MQFLMGKLLRGIPHRALIQLQIIALSANIGELVTKILRLLTLGFIM